MLAALGALTVSLASACSWGSPGGMEVGSGEVESERRTVSSFTAVETGGGIRLELATGPQQVVVTAQPNILGITRTEVSGSRLEVSTTSGYVSPNGIVVTITAPRLDAVDLSGGASATGEVPTSAAFELDLSGGARVTLTGKAADLDLQASGGAIVELGELAVTNARVELSGGVVANLDVSGSLTGNASGGVVLTLRERPASADVETSGGAVVRGL